VDAGDAVMNILDTIVYVLDELMYFVYLGMHPNYFGFRSQSRGCLNQAISFAVHR
jgi:hypothetical protein